MNDVQMDHVVFIKFVRTNRGVVDVYVTDSAKNYETSSVGMWDLNNDSAKLEYRDTTHRVDMHQQRVGMWVANQNDALLTGPDNGFQTFEYPLFGYTITNKVLSVDKNGKKTYKVVPTNLSDAQKEVLVANFQKKYPNHFVNVKNRYIQKRNSGEYVDIHERLAISLEKERVSTNTDTLSAPFTADDVKNASFRQLRNWCAEMGLATPKSADSARSALSKFI